MSTVQHTSQKKNSDILKNVLNARILGLSQSLCKPPNWCKIEIPVWRFNYGKKKSRKSTKNSNAENDA